VDVGVRSSDASVRHSSTEGFRQKIPFHQQLPDLGVQFLHLAFPSKSSVKNGKLVSVTWRFGFPKYLILPDVAVPRVGSLQTGVPIAARDVA
jgi:hypothetical protein